MGHLGIRIINIVLFTMSCFFAASIVNHVAESQLAPDYVSSFQPVVRSEPEKPKRQERNAILERNLFGAKLEGSEASEPPPPVEVVEEAQATKLPLELIGTMAGVPDSLSSAVVNNTRTKKHQVVRIGDVLDDYDYVTVSDIEPGRIVLRNRDVVEELLLDKNASAVGTSVASRQASRADAMQRMRERRARRTKKANRDAAIPAAPFATPAEDDEDDEAEARLQRIQQAMSKDLIRDLEPAMNDDGGIEGVLVGGIEEDSILARAGLEPDDVITSLNGIDINSAGAAARVLRELAKCQPMTGSVDGPSGTRTLEITPALLRELNCTN